MSFQITPEFVTAATRLTANSIPCGIGGGLSGFTDAINEATAIINQVIEDATDIIAAVQNLPATIIAEVEAIATEAINGLISELEIPSIKLPDEIRELLDLASNPGAFLLKYIEILQQFPQLALDDLLKKIQSLTSFNICSMVPNLQIINGEIVERAPENPPATSNATELPAQAEIPTPVSPEPPPNTSLVAQRVIVENLPRVGENSELTAAQRQARISQYAAELDANNNQLAGILRRLEQARPGSSEFNNLREEGARLNRISENLRANRPR